MNQVNFFTLIPKRQARPKRGAREDTVTGIVILKRDNLQKYEKGEATSNGGFILMFLVSEKGVIRLSK